MAALHAAAHSSLAPLVPPPKPSDLPVNIIHCLSQQIIIEAHSLLKIYPIYADFLIN